MYFDIGKINEPLLGKCEQIENLKDFLIERSDCEIFMNDMGKTPGFLNFNHEEQHKDFWYSVYIIRRKQSSKPYIGSVGGTDTSKIRRVSNDRYEEHERTLRNDNHSSFHFKNSYNKYKNYYEYEFEIVKTFDNVIDMEKFETDLIHEFKRNGIGCYNISLFARSPMRGLTHPLATIEKMKQSQVKAWTIKRREKQREKLNEKWATPGELEKHKENQIETLGEKNMCFELDGTYVQTFRSFSEASEFISTNYPERSSAQGGPGRISQICAGHEYSAYGFLWCDLDTDRSLEEIGIELSNKYIEGQERKKNALINSNIEKRIPVNQFDIKGNFVSNFKSYIEAGESINKGSCHISTCVGNKKHFAHGFYWFSTKEQGEEWFKTRITGKVILQCDKFGEIINVSLAERVQALMKRCGFAAKGLFVMDGSRRSAHGNAYFTGLGAAKRVVFFDTLLAKLAPGEVEAVLAHELGHFKHKHVTQRIVMMLLMSLAGLALLGWLAGQSGFYTGLGVQPNIGTPNNALALLLFLMVVPVFGFFASPVMAQLSRKHEFQADAYACAQADGNQLASALIKLHEDNASTLTPDPLYVRFYYSHPPASERLAALSPQPR